MLSSEPARAQLGNMNVPRLPVNRTFAGDSGSPLTSKALNAPAAQEVDSMRRLAFYAGVAMIFVRMSVLPEMMAYLTGANTYILYLVGPPALIGLLISGGFVRSFQSRVAWCWTGVFIWMILATPTSSWPGGSAQVISGYARTNLLCLFVLAGTVARWKDIKLIFTMMAGAGFMVLCIVKFLAKPDAEGRLAFAVLDSPIGYANDLAAHVLLLLPFILYFGFKPGQNALMRLFAFGGAFYSIWIILGTSSRGAMLGLVAMSVFLFFKASRAQRVAVLVVVPVLVALLVTILPKQNLERLSTTFSEDTNGATEGIAAGAGESRASRTYLLKKSIQYTIQHPLFGVGPGQFSTFEGFASRAVGQHGNWHETHNTYTQISSECGVPALILALAAMIGSLSIVGKTLKRARALGSKEIAAACLCYLMSWGGYLVTIIFLAHAYQFTLPAMLGMAIAIHLAAEREFAGLAPAASPNISSMRPGMPVLRPMVERGVFLHR